MATFRVLPGKCVQLTGQPPLAGRFVVEGETFDGEPERLQHLLSLGIAEILQESTREIIGAGSTEVERPPPAAISEVKVGRRK